MVVNEREVAVDLLQAGRPPCDLLADKGFNGEAFTVELAALGAAAGACRRGRVPALPHGPALAVPPASCTNQLRSGGGARIKLGMSERATGEVRWSSRAASVRAWLALAGALIRAGIRRWTVNR